MGAAAAAPALVPVVPAGVAVDGFGVPPFLLPIYQAAGLQYGVRWEILAAINEIETNYGRNLNISSAGALGWMQFMPPSWRAHGTDANRDGLLDPYNPVDAIFAAARYLNAAGVERDLRGAIFAYNHADWYVDAVLKRAQELAGLPPGLIGSLTWLAQGRYPVSAPARAGAAPGRAVRISSRPGAAVVAVNDLRIVAIGRSRRHGRYVRARDAVGNTYTYARLGTLVRYHPVRRPHDMSRSVARALRRARLPGSAFDPATQPASTPGPIEKRLSGPVARPPVRRTPVSPTGVERYAASAEDSRRLGIDPRDAVPRILRRGSRVVAGTILGRVRERTADRAAPGIRFEIRPAASGALPVDPEPILAGWRLLQRAAPRYEGWRYAVGGRGGRVRSLGQILLMRKGELIRRVLGNLRVRLYACGRQDVRMGRIDRRVLAALEYLAASGLRPTVTSLRCGHSRLTAGGRVSYHASGNAVDIAAVNGTPVLGHQGAGSITDQAVRRLLALQGSMRPDEVISLMTYPDAPNAHAMGDHADHIHLGYRPPGTRVGDSLGPRQWVRFISRLRGLGNPKVRVAPSHAALRSATRTRATTP